MDYSRFEAVFPQKAFAYEKRHQQEIEAFRKSVDGTLFIDRVLKAVGITKGKL